MKIFILGSEGFIGNHCVRFFQKKGYNVYGADLLDIKQANYQYNQVSRLQPAFDEFFRNENFDVCINAAGSGSVPVSFQRPYNDFEANTVDVVRLLETIRLTNPTCKYLNISSAAIYGNPKVLPITEDSEPSPLSPYGWHKYYSELVCKEYAQLHGLFTCSVRPFSVYGPGLRKQLFWDIYQKTLNGNNIELFGTGDESRDFIYINDLVSAIDILITSSAMKGHTYNLASGKEITIKEAATIFCEYLSDEISIKFNQQQKVGDPLNWKADISKITDLGFVPKTDLKSGLLELAKWIKEKK